MAKTTTKGPGTRKLTPATRIGGKTVATPTGKLEAIAPTKEKVTNQILMLAADDVGITFLVNKASVEFYVPLDDPNYAAMSSLLFSVHSSGAHVAVKYTEPSLNIVSKRRRATAVAKGVHAVISGASF